MSQQINLYQPILGRQAVLFSARAMGIALLVLLAGLGTMGAYMHWQVGKFETALGQAGVRHQEASTRLAEVSEKLKQAEDPELAAAVERAGTELAAERALHAVLQRGSFGNTAGFSSYFVALARAHPGGMWLDGIRVEGAGEFLALRGATTDPELVPRYLKRLADYPVLAGRSFMRFEMSLPAAEPQPDDAQRPTVAAPWHQPTAIRFQVATRSTDDEEQER